MHAAFEAGLTVLVPFITHYMVILKQCFQRKTMSPRPKFQSASMLTAPYVSQWSIDHFKGEHAQTQIWSNFTLRTHTKFGIKIFEIDFVMEILWYFTFWPHPKVTSLTLGQNLTCILFISTSPSIWYATKMKFWTTGHAQVPIPTPGAWPRNQNKNHARYVSYLLFVKTHTMFGIKSLKLTLLLYLNNNWPLDSSPVPHFWPLSRAPWGRAKANFCCTPNSYEQLTHQIWLDFVRQFRRR